MEEVHIVLYRDEISREEFLPGFSAEFPYIRTHAALDRYLEPFAPWHWHKAVELFYMEKGSLEYVTPGGRWVFPEGSGGFINSNVLHSTIFQNPVQGSTQLIHLFDPSFIAGEHGSLIEQKYVFPLTSAHHMEVLPLYPENENHAQILREIRSAFDLSQKEWGYEIKLRNQLALIWLKLFALADIHEVSDGGNPLEDSQVKTMMVYIHEHYQDPISVEELAESTHISKRTCFRLFQEKLHMTPLDYIRSFRLQSACRMLLKSDESIVQIALGCGFGSGSYFSKIFKEELGCSPAQYRKKGNR